MPTYQEKLKDPRWQKKRLEILERDGWKCRSCHHGDMTLNVHHSFYEKDKDPWDYPSESLVTLCDECHVDEEENKYASEKALIRALRGKGYTNYFFEELASAFETSNFNQRTTPCIELLLSCILCTDTAFVFLDNELSKAMNNEPSLFTPSEETNGSKQND